MKTTLTRTLLTISLASACALATTFASLNANAATETANLGVSASIAEQIDVVPGSAAACCCPFRSGARAAA